MFSVVVVMGTEVMISGVLVVGANVEEMYDLLEAGVSVIDSVVEVTVSSLE